VRRHRGLSARRGAHHRAVAESSQAGTRGGLGATDILPERGDEAIERIRSITEGIGADAVLECVGTTESLATAFAVARPGPRVGIVGVPADVDAFPTERAFEANVGLAGGMAPVQAYLPTLLELVRSGRIDPGRVFDMELPMAEAAADYVEMDERRAIKVLLRP
jgi:threonine dehydrogenase-like Zn-dependent dehydrogenase